MKFLSHFLKYVIATIVVLATIFGVLQLGVPTGLLATVAALLFTLPLSILVLVLELGNGKEMTNTGYFTQKFLKFVISLIVIPLSLFAFVFIGIPEGFLATISLLIFVLPLLVIVFLGEQKRKLSNRGICEEQSLTE